MLLIALFISGIPIAQSQLSGEVSLAGDYDAQAKKDNQTGPQTKEITVTGIGTTLEYAEKQALASAIRQTVGAYIDSKTIVENEEVLQDRILSVSDAFVEKYQVIGQPKKSADGLVEITIIAMVKTNQVVQALKESNLISGEVAGQNIWAAASTKVMNAQDAVAMLQAKLPELLKSSLTITPLDAKLMPKVTKDPSGNIVPSTEPVDISKNIETGEATLTWIFEIGVNKDYYHENVVPVLSKCLTSITESDPEHGRMQWEQKKQSLQNLEYFGQKIQYKDSYVSIHKNKILETNRNNIVDHRINSNGWGGCPHGLVPRNFFILVKSFSKNYDSCDFIFYPYPKNTLDIKFKDRLNGQVSEGIPASRINLEMLDNKSQLIAASQSKTWQPIFSNKQKRDSSFVVGYNMDGLNFIARPFTLIQINLPIESLKDISKVNVTLEVNEPVFTLKSVNN